MFCLNLEKRDFRVEIEKRGLFSQFVRKTVNFVSVKRSDRDETL